MSRRSKKKRLATNAVEKVANAVGTHAPEKLPAGSKHEPQPPSTKVATSQGASPPTPLKVSRMRRVARQLRWRAQWLMPNLIPDSDLSGEWRRARDKESNEETRVDPCDELRIRAVWGVDLFGPNESDRLYQALRLLGWNNGIGGAEDGALTWVQQQRTYGHGGSYNVGVVTRSAEAQKFLSLGNHAVLPEEVDYLIVRFQQVVPTVTCIVVCFVLKEAVTTRYEQELNLDRETKKERQTRWRLSYLEPTHVKQRAIERVRNDFRFMVSGWFLDNLPGYFAHLNLPGRFPTTELLSTRSDDMFTAKPGSADFDWRQIMANVSQYDIWTSCTTPGLRFVEQQARWPSERENSLLACVSIQSLPSDRMEMYGGDSGAIVAICNESFEGFLAYFCVKAYLAEVARDLKGSREELSVPTSNRKTMQTVDRIQRFFNRNAGVPAVARELRDLTKTRGRFEHYCENFTAISWIDDGVSRKIVTELSEYVHFRSLALIEDESSTREHFEQLSTILSIRESVRAQRKMEFLTVVALFVATMSLIAAVPDSWTNRLKLVFASLPI